MGKHAHNLYRIRQLILLREAHSYFNPDDSARTVVRRHYPVFETLIRRTKSTSRSSTSSTSESVRLRPKFGLDRRLSTRLVSQPSFLGLWMRDKNSLRVEKYKILFGLFRQGLKLENRAARFGAARDSELLILQYIV